MKQHGLQNSTKRRYQADPGTVMRVINRLTPFSAVELLELELPIRMSFEFMRSGSGTLNDYSNLELAINVAMVRSEDVDPFCVQTAVAARDALLRTWERHQRTGRWGFDGPALAEIDAGIELHEQLVRNSTPLQMIQAGREVKRRDDARRAAA